MFLIPILQGLVIITNENMFPIILAPSLDQLGPTVRIIVRFTSVPIRVKSRIEDGEKSERGGG